MAEEFTVDGDNVIVQQTFRKQHYLDARVFEMASLQAQLAELQQKISDLQNVIDSLSQ